MSDASREGPGMDFTEPGWWSLFAVAVAAFFGWRIKAAQDAVRIETMQRDMDTLRQRLASLESGSANIAITLAGQGERLEGIVRTLLRIEGRLEGKADK